MSINHCFLRLFLVVFALGTAFLSVSNAQTSADFAGTWYSAVGGATITVTEKDGFVDVIGKDDASTYACSGIIERTAEGAFAECYGMGTKKIANQRFSYKSRLKMIDKGQAIEETWEAKQFLSGEVKKITGNATFRRENPANKKNESLFIRNQISKRCVDVQGGPGTANGSKILLWDCEYESSNTDQRWTMTSEGFIKNQISGKCLDVAGAPATENHSAIILFDCEYNNPDTDQKWTITDTGFIKNQLSGRCLDVEDGPGTENGSAIILYDCEAPDSDTVQKWSFVKAPLVEPEFATLLLTDIVSLNLRGGGFAPRHLYR